MRKLVNKLAAVTLSSALIGMIISPSLSAQPFNKELSEVRTYTGHSMESYIDGPLDEARFNYPSSFAYLPNGSIVVSDAANHVIRLISANQVSTLAGLPYVNVGEHTFQGGFLDGSEGLAAFNSPAGLAVSEDGTIYVADSANHAIRKMSLDGTVVTYAGNGELGVVDGEANQAQFYNPSDIAIDSKGNVYVADTLNHVIRKISTSGYVTTINKLSTRLVEYTPGNIDLVGDFADGDLSEALFNEPTSLLLDAHDNLYVADRGNQRIRYIDFSSNTVTTVAGSGKLFSDELYVDGGYVDGAAESAMFFSPEGMAWLDDQTLLIADRKNHTIRQLKNGVVSTIAGFPEEYGDTNGVIGSALFNEPADILVDQDGSILVLDSANNQIRKLSSYTHFISSAFSTDVEVIVNGTLLATKAEIRQSRTLLPLRAIGDALQLSVHYDEQTKKITLSDAMTKYEFTTNVNTVTKIVDGDVVNYKLDMPATNINNMTYIPVRFISEQLNLNVAWDSKLKNVVIRDYIFN